MKPPTRDIRLTSAALIILAAPLFAQEAAPAPEAAEALAPASDVAVRAGGDVRVRQEAFDNIPIKTAEPPVTRGGNNNYFRFRTRLFLGVDVGEHLSFDARAANEVRARNVGLKSYEWPDELILDALNLKLKNVLDGRLDLTLGRQDVKLGSGRLFAEGTAKDGSRTQFFDGVLARVRLAETTTLDLFGFYGNCENKLAVGHEHRDMTGYAGGFTDMDESSAGFFLTDTTFAAADLGLYYVWKHDSAWSLPDGSPMASEDIHTLGARLVPHVTETLSGELEAAYQFSGGDYDREATFAVAGLRLGAKTGAYASVNALRLSGDDPDTAGREDFNVLYGRYPWISELVLYGFDGDGVGVWNNIGQYWLEAGYVFGKGHVLKATAGFLDAPERNGAGGGHDRGWLETLFYAFPVPRCEGLSAHLFLEILEPGDYYVSDKTAYFFRWELNWAF